MKYIHPTSYIGLIVAALMIASTIISMQGYTRINRSGKVLMNLYQLRTDISSANLALRNAGMARTDAQMEQELAKMLITRASANEIYDALAAAPLEPEDTVLLSEMKKERIEYREAQLKVVALVRKHNDGGAWDAMMYYQPLMDRYLARVDKLIHNVTACNKKKYNNARTTMLVALIASLAIGACAIRRVYWGPCND